jgi:capsule polysaccharide export protein KpsE/RkpR
MRIDIHVYTHNDDLAKLLGRMEDRIVTQLTDAIKAASDAADGAISRTQADVSALRQQVADLEAQVASGGASQADMQALSDLKAKLDALDPTVPGP